MTCSVMVAFKVFQTRRPMIQMSKNPYETSFPPKGKPWNRIFVGCIN